jgi:hypothetical protein
MKPANGQSDTNLGGFGRLRRVITQLTVVKQGVKTSLPVGTAKEGLAAALREEIIQSRNDD